ncbi:MAG: SEL1-like repeat protein [Synergistaceae bacterium]|nr:SEL1-like repeat protein [Synergistaceae bacterium]
MRKMRFAAVVLVMLLACSAFGDDFNVLMKRARNGDIYAQFRVGRMYQTGDGVAQDYRKAREWYEKAAAQNYGWAFHNLGWMYQEALGVKVDYRKAFEYYTKGAERGIARSFNQLGWFYEQGLWVKFDYKQAFYWYTKAAEGGDHYGLNNLGHMYENGINTSRDLRKAMEYYRQSAAKGNKKAQEALARLETQQKPSAPAVATTPPTPATPPKPRLAVLDVEDKSEERKANPLHLADTKLRLAVRTLDDKCDIGKKTASAITDLMIDELGNTHLFALMEREHFDDYLGREVNIGQSGLVDPSTAPSVGKMKGIQYHMMGSIMFCKYYEKGSGVVIPILGIATQSKTAYVVIHIRIVDSSTGEIVYTARQTGSYKQTSKGASANYRGFFIGGYSKETGGLLEQAALDAVMKHVSAIKERISHS